MRTGGGSEAGAVVPTNTDARRAARREFERRQAEALPYVRALLAACAEVGASPDAVISACEAARVPLGKLYEAGTAVRFLAPRK